MTTVLRDSLAGQGLNAHEGPSWTTDAVYRETIAEARAYQAEGILTVEMEAAALFAVAQYRDVELASAFVISDHLLAADGWVSQIRSDRVAAALLSLLDASVFALGGYIAPAA